MSMDKYLMVEIFAVQPLAHVMSNSDIDYATAAWALVVLSQSL